MNNPVDGLPVHPAEPARLAMSSDADMDGWMDISL